MRSQMQGGSAVLLGATLLAAGCGQSVVVPRRSLQSEISRQLAAASHRRAPKIDCAKELAGKVGAAERCVLSDPVRRNVRLSVDVRVDSVSGSRVHFSIRVGSSQLK